MLECGLVWMAHAEDGFEAASAATMSDAGDPLRAARPRRGRPVLPQLRRRRAGLPAARAGGRRAARAARDAGAGAPGRRARREGGPGGGDARTATGCGSTTGARSRPTSPSGRAAPGSGRCSPRTSTSARRARSCSSSTAGPRGRRRTCPPTSTSTTRSTARATSTGSASRRRRTSTGRRSRPTPSCRPPRRTRRRSSRAFLRERFPALADAPLAGSKTCRYELTSDAHFVAAPLPEHPSVWLLGGGSGHGFKHAPALGEAVAAALRDGAPLPAAVRARTARHTGGHVPDGRRGHALARIAGSACASATSVSRSRGERSAAAG